MLTASRIGGILAGDRFRVRDLWPVGIRYLTCHLTPWSALNERRMFCGTTDNGVTARVWSTPDGWRYHLRIAAGHPTVEGRILGSVEAVEPRPYPTQIEAQCAADAALLDWFALRIADGTVIYPWPAVPVGPSLFGSIA